MYLAEIRGKLSKENENREDILTSNVFSFFKYASRKEFLYPFISSLDIEITQADALDAEFLFWPKYDSGTEPDLVLLIGNYYLLFEAKYHSSFGKATPFIKPQLIREIEEGYSEARTLDKEFRLFALTADYYEKPELKNDVPVEFSFYVKWISWQRIALFLYQVLESNQNLSLEIHLFAEDLYHLLIRKNLRKYEGTKVLVNIPQISSQAGDIFFKASTANFRGDFIGFSQAFWLDEEFIKTSKIVFFTGATANFRGDFLGFIEVLNLTRLLSNPSHIFYSPRSIRLFQSSRQIGQIKSSTQELFFKRRSYGPQ